MGRYGGWGYDDGDDRTWQDTQQACLNGHVITDFAVSQPERRRAHCATCGAATIEACPQCRSALRGYMHVPGVFAVTSSKVDRNCADCGHPLPWTAQRRSVVKEWLENLASLSASDREELEGMLGDIFTNTARSELAAFRVKKIIAKLDGDEAAPFLKTLIAAADPAVAPKLPKAL